LAREVVEVNKITYLFAIRIVKNMIFLQMQDHFRDNDIIEYRRMKKDLGSLAKTCRNLQLKLKRTQALRQKEKLMKEKASHDSENPLLAVALETQNITEGQVDARESNSAEEDEIESSRELWKSAAIW